MLVPYLRERSSPETLKIFPDIQGVLRPKIKIAIEYKGMKQERLSQCQTPLNNGFEAIKRAGELLKNLDAGDWGAVEFDTFVQAIQGYADSHIVKKK